ncbi:hypothetical protein ACEW7V_00405 [Areca yellow leaf disease phytoplasma]
MTPALLVGGGIFNLFLASGLIKFLKTTKYSGYGKWKLKSSKKSR